MNNDACNYQINPAGIGKDVMSIRNLRILLQLLHDIYILISQQPDRIKIQMKHTDLLALVAQYKDKRIKFIGQKLTKLSSWIWLQQHQFYLL